MNKIICCITEWILNNNHYFTLFLWQQDLFCLCKTCDFMFADPIFWIALCNKEIAVSLDWIRQTIEETVRQACSRFTFPEAVFWGYVLYTRGTKITWWSCKVSTIYYMYYAMQQNNNKHEHYKLTIEKTKGAIIKDWQSNPETQATLATRQRMKSRKRQLRKR